jgi:hypothetical protein
MGIYDEPTRLDKQSPTKRGIAKTIDGDEKSTLRSTRNPTRKMEPSRVASSAKPREKSRGQSRDLPTRDEIQEFSFRLRDELKVKVQAEMPHSWQKEFAEMTRKLDVKKLELYRFILGEFLGKVKRRKIA